MIKEDPLQQQIYTWYNNNYCLKTNPNRSLIFAIPNGGFRKIKEAVKLKATGTLAGVSDLIINHLGRWICVELKTEVGKQSDAQKDFQIRVEKLGTPYFLVRSLKEFQDVIYSLDKTNNLYNQKNKV